jgi:hypothetical protein
MSSSRRVCASLAVRVSLRLGFVFGITLVALGCGQPKSAQVSGTVFLSDGKPMPGGSITFYPMEGAKTLPSTVDIKEDGKFDMRKAPVGKVQVAVSNLHLKEGTPPPVGAGGGMNMKGPMGKGPKDGMGPPKSATEGKPADRSATPPPTTGKYVEIPAKYTKPESSEWDFEVKPGTQTQDFKIK